MIIITILITTSMAICSTLNAATCNFTREGVFQSSCDLACASNSAKACTSSCKTHVATLNTGACANPITTEEECKRWAGSVPGFTYEANETAVNEHAANIPPGCYVKTMDDIGFVWFSGQTGRTQCTPSRRCRCADGESAISANECDNMECKAGETCTDGKCLCGEIVCEVGTACMENRCQPPDDNGVGEEGSGPTTSTTISARAAQEAWLVPILIVSCLLACAGIGFLVHKHVISKKKHTHTRTDEDINAIVGKKQSAVKKRAEQKRRKVKPPKEPQ